MDISVQSVVFFSTLILSCYSLSRHSLVFLLLHLNSYIFKIY